MSSVGIIGLGNIGSALLEGLATSDYDGSLVGFDRDAEKRRVADELSQLHREESVDAALQRYKARRLDRVKEARAVTRSRYWWIHDSFPGIATLRKVVAPLIPVNHFTKEYKDLLETKP